ncbi:MAG: hypothetical protein LBB39_03485 [Mycoplasmataceae bacterium]|jgi:hypothetical protein|nr:hypothetical protein [Mycoplasmataceae bacterium]
MKDKLGFDKDNAVNKSMNKKQVKKSKHRFGVKRNGRKDIAKAIKETRWNIQKAK